MHVFSLAGSLLVTGYEVSLSIPWEAVFWSKGMNFACLLPGRQSFGLRDWILLVYFLRAGLLVSGYEFCLSFPWEAVFWSRGMNFALLFPGRQSFGHRG